MSREYSTASLTVEAALVLPLFLFAALCIIYINKLLLYEETVEQALVRTGRELSVEYAASRAGAVVSKAYMTGKMVRYAGESGGKISMLRSRFVPETDEIDLIADYSIRVPFPVISHKRFYFSHRYRTRAFTGVETRMEADDVEGEEIVYITKTGNVYHKSLECSYLKLTISQVKYSDLEHLRSEGGAKYYACEGCCRHTSFSGAQNVFICNYGNRFHISRTCNKIKRSIQKITLSEAGGRLPCSKCGRD